MPAFGNHLEGKVNARHRETALLNKVLRVSSWPGSKLEHVWWCRCRNSAGMPLSNRINEALALSLFPILDSTLVTPHGLGIVVRAQTIELGHAQPIDLSRAMVLRLRHS